MLTLDNWFLLLFLLLVIVCLVFPSRTEGTAPAVDDIVFCPKKAGEAELLGKGYERLEPMLKAVGLGKVRTRYHFFIFVSDGHAGCCCLGRSLLGEEGLLTASSPCFKPPGLYIKNGKNIYEVCRVCCPWYGVVLPSQCGGRAASERRLKHSRR